MITVTSEKQHFTKWESVPAELKTKTQWKKEGYKPQDEGMYDATISMRTPYGSRIYCLYHIKNCTPLKRKKVKEVEITKQNLAEALYQINKSAKASRDAKRTAYKRRDHSTTQSCKTRELKHYALKNAVINKLIDDGYVNVVGYHVQKQIVKEKVAIPLTEEEIENQIEELKGEYFNTGACEYEKLDDFVEFHLERERYDIEYVEKEVYFIMYEIEGFTFHQPAFSNEIDGLKYLGVIDEITKEKTVKTNLNYQESVKLLEKYVGKTMKELYEEEHPQRVKKENY